MCMGRLSALAALAGMLFVAGCGCLRHKRHVARTIGAGLHIPDRAVDSGDLRVIYAIGQLVRILKIANVIERVERCACNRRIFDARLRVSVLIVDRRMGEPLLYLAGRWLEHYPASELCFAQIAKPGKRRKQMGASLVSTSRTPGQLRGVLARLALAASQITACYERYGPDRPWGFADPTSWKCGPRYCSHYFSCPGGAGL
jgi:hypothetical protein